MFSTLPVTLKLVPCITTTRGQHCSAPARHRLNQISHIVSWYCSPFLLQHLAELIEGLRWRLSLAHTFIQVFNRIQVRRFGRPWKHIDVVLIKVFHATRAVCGLALSCWNNSLCRSITCMRWVWRMSSLYLTAVKLSVLRSFEIAAHIMTLPLCNGVNTAPKYGILGLMPCCWIRLRTVCELILCNPGIPVAVVDTATVRFRRWKTPMYQSCPGVVMRGLPLLWRSFVEPVCWNLFHSLEMVLWLTFRVRATWFWDSGLERTDSDIPSGRV